MRVWAFSAGFFKNQVKVPCSVDIRQALPPGLRGTEEDHLLAALRDVSKSRFLASIHINTQSCESQDNELMIKRLVSDIISEKKKKTARQTKCSPLTQAIRRGVDLNHHATLISRWKNYHEA